MRNSAQYAVSAGHPIAVQIAENVLNNGGNAIDAGIAACIALTVLRSEQVQLGGICPMIVRPANDSDVYVVDGVGRWPAATDTEVFRTNYRGRIPQGILRSVVPAAPSAWTLALRRFGTGSLQAWLDRLPSSLLPGFL